ncbi:MAG TPA: FAD:protein FMN transferase [Ktedonobacteraceae bacterium]
MEPAVHQAAVLHQPSAEPTPPDYSTPAGMRREEFRAMGTTISLLLPENQAERGAQIVRDLFAEWEQVLSRFIADSELSRLNQAAGTPVAVSDLLYSVLATALTAARATEGVYDPAMLDQLEKIGYDRTFDDIRASDFDPIIPGEPGGRWRGIKINPIYREVTLPAGIKLDFGGIAKGMAVDAALERLRESGISPALVNAGGDLAVLGLPPNDDDRWPIAVPGRERYWSLPLHHGAIATSGIAHRNWRQGNTLRHHLLDPRTGLPAQSDLWSVTVVADRCEQAEVAAKVAFILSSRQGADFLREHHIAGILIHEDGTWETVEPWPAYIMKEEENI